MAEVKMARSDERLGQKENAPRDDVGRGPGATSLRCWPTGDARAASAGRGGGTAAGGAGVKTEEGTGD